MSRETPLWKERGETAKLKSQNFMLEWVKKEFKAGDKLIFEGGEHRGKTATFVEWRRTGWFYSIYVKWDNYKPRTGPRIVLRQFYMHSHKLVGKD